jgi:C1A family cysteine protease
VVKYLSPAYLYAKTRITEGSFPEDVGATIADEVVTLQTLGVCPESALIYSGQPGQLPTPKNDVQARPFRCGVPESVDSSDPSNLEAALSGGQTVVFGMPVYSSFEDVGADGMVPIPGLAEECLGGHCMLAVGYDHAAGLLTVRNSWGTDWGVGGHCFIPYAMISQFAEAWVIPITP